MKKKHKTKENKENPKANQNRGYYRAEPIKAQNKTRKSLLSGKAQVLNLTG